MKQFIIWAGLITLLCTSCASKQKHELSVLHLNIWMDATVVDHGFDAVVDEIVRVDPDIVMLSEADNRDGVLIVPRFIEALQKKGKDYFGESSSLDVALLSKYPLSEQTENIPHKDRVIRTRLDVKWEKVVGVGPATGFKQQERLRENRR